MKITFLTRGVKCVLWDLDGTLVSTGGAGVRALEGAFLSLHGLPNAMRRVDPSGKTDPAIIREIFKMELGRDCAAEEMELVQKTYLENLPGECGAAEGYRVMDGIPEILSRLDEKRVVMGLGTGNLERGARIKLERSGLNPWLPFGGFGSDHEHRPSLLKIGHQKAEGHAGVRVDPSNVFVVGDTERDILAAREAGFKVIAAATGGTSSEVLKAHGPDFYVDHFKDVNGFLDIIG